MLCTRQIQKNNAKKTQNVTQYIGQSTHSHILGGNPQRKAWISGYTIIQTVGVK